MKIIICFFFFFFLLVTLSNALRITKLDPTHVSRVISHHHHHVDHDLRRERLSHGADTSKIILPTVSSSVPDYTESSPLVKKDATEDNDDLPSFTKVDNDHFQNQLQVHLINRFNKYSDLPGHPYNPHKCRHHLRLIAYYPRLIDRDAPFSRNLVKGQGDHELHMLDQFTRPHYIILRHRHHHHHHRHDHHDVKDDQTYEEKTEMVEDQHDESEQKDKEHEHESRKKDLLIKLRKFLPYF